MINFTKLTVFSNGVRVLNCTPHPIAFLDGENVVVVEPCGARLNALPVETSVVHTTLGGGFAQLVKTTFDARPEGLAELAEIEAKAPGVLPVGSLVSAQAYPGRVVAMTPAPGFERVAPAEKRMSTLKFTVY